MDPKSVLLGLREKSVGLSKAQTRIPWREIINGVAQNEDYAFMLYQRALSRCKENDRDAVCIADAQFRVGKCYLNGIGTYKNIEKAYELLSLALVGFYKRRKKDNFVIELIKPTKELLAQAQEHLDKETSDYQRKPDVLLDDMRY